MRERTMGGAVDRIKGGTKDCVLHGGEWGGCAEDQTNLCPYHPSAPNPYTHQKWVEELLPLAADT